ncbi:peroxidase [Negadavirga shengliensis]|uniref:Peroxidase n=1 Tax=Negadavirga shengliensis TaxID=1389218 RepID=A0ABV9SZH2_9BACT
MSSIHKGLTVTVSIDEDRLEAVNALLEGFRKDLADDVATYRQKLPSTFFISWLTLPAQSYAEKEQLPARILLMTSYVGSKRRHIKELASVMGKHLKMVFGHSHEFPHWVEGNKGMEDFLNKKGVFHAFYSGFKFVLPEDVPKEKHLKETVYTYLNEQRSTEGFDQPSPEQIKQKIEAFICDNPDLKWAYKRPHETKRDRLKMLVPLLLFACIMLGSLVCLVLSFFMDVLILKIGAIILPAFLLVMFFLFLWLRINENNPHIPNKPVEDGWIRKIVMREKNPVINEMTVIAPLKKGWIRRIFLAVSLRLISLVGYFTYIPTVHTARWLQIDKGKRLVFIANFDNISEAYAHDFVDSENRSRNLSVIFSHAAGFPPTKWLVKKGYNHRSEYMKGVRAHQKITQFWYAFNTELSVENLKTNRRFREGLFKSMDEDKLREWLLTI